MPMPGLSNRISTAFSTMFKSVGKQTDHKRLTNYIITINQKESTEDILSELSDCLKEILNYRLFAFVLQRNTDLDIWLDPRIYRESLEKVVMKDFNIQDKTMLNYLNLTGTDKDNADNNKGAGDNETINMEKLSSYEINEEDYLARIYILPHKGLFDFYDDEIDMIIKTTQTAVSRQIEMQKLADAAATDPLTKCYNRREFENQLNRHVSNSERHNKELSVFMFDLDHFKEVNDTYGHQSGDTVLKSVSALVKNNIRTADILARYGGEEFIAILPETSRDRAIELANRIREKIAGRRIKVNGDEIRVTASFGVTSLKESPSINRLVADADAMLYKSKLNGRNIVMPGLIKVCPSIDLKEKVKS